MADCTTRTIQICGEAYERVIEFQHQYKMKHKRHLSFTRAVNKMLKGMTILTETDNK